VDRVQIEVTLNNDRTWLVEKLAALAPEELAAPATPSEHDPSLWWSLGDHFVHLSLIEHNFVAMVRRFLEGNPNPVGLRQRDDGSERSMDDVMAMVHAMTEDWAVKHRGKPFSELLAVSQAARGETLQLLGELTDQQLSQKIPGAPWADGTVGGVLAVHAMHGRMHYKWAKDGLASRANGA
jgi:hypothetical protein